MTNLFRLLIAKLSFFFKNKRVNKKNEVKIIEQIVRFHEKNDIINNNKLKTHVIFNNYIEKLIIEKRFSNFLQESVIQKIFFVQGMAIGILGSIFGVLLGVLVATNIDVIVPTIESLFGVHFLPKDIYFISELPSDVHLEDVVKVGGMAFILSLLATLYPSYRAAKVKPAEALRYE